MDSLKVSPAMELSPCFGTQALFVPPPMTMERYANMQGVELGVIENQVRKGILPSIKVGKRRLINTFAFAQKCLEKDPVFKAKDSAK